MMFKATLSIIFGAWLASSTVLAAERELVDHNRLMDHGDGHLMDMEGGMVMGQNKEQLPPGCSKISEDVEITAKAGHQYAKDFPGTMFGFDQHEWRVKPCSRVTVHFINEDHIRHQWMMHGLPKFIYDKGMFHLEITGPAKISGTFIVPAEDRTYLVHCDIAQHMEKGMKGQLIVGKGSAPFPSIPGISDLAIPDHYPVVETPGVPVQAAPAASTPPAEPSSGAFVLGIILSLIGMPFLMAYYREHCRNMTASAAAACFLNAALAAFGRLWATVEGWFGKR